MQHTFESFYTGLHVNSETWEYSADEGEDQC